jgi:hypothetical protein
VTVDREVNAEVEVVDIEDLTPDPGALREAERRINDVARLAEVVDASINEADQAATAALAAKSKSARMFQQKQAIEALQDAGVASSEVLVSLAESQKHLFENQQALSNLIRELTGYALGSIANTRLVYARLQAALSGASAGELNELAERELRNVMLEVKRQLDLADQQARTDRKLSELREQLGQQRRMADEAMAESLRERQRLQGQVRNATVVAIVGIALSVGAMLLAILS